MCIWCKGLVGTCQKRMVLWAIKANFTLYRKEIMLYCKIICLCVHVHVQVAINILSAIVVHVHENVCVDCGYNYVHVHVCVDYITCI